MADDENGKIAVPQQRSPAYPYISLELALERARRIHSAVRDHAQPREVLAKAYGKPATSSATIQTFATLSQYGLLENVPSALGRKMRVSALAQEALNQHAPREKVQKALRQAALNPQIFGELWSRYGDMEGLDDSVPLYYLVTERAHEASGGVFTEKAARDVLRIYRSTLSYSGISGSENSQVDEDDPEDDARDTAPLDAQAATPAAHPQNAPRAYRVGMDFFHDQLPQGMRREVITLDEGDVIITFPDTLSGESVSDLKAHLDLFIRKAQRRTGVISKAEIGAD